MNLHDEIKRLCKRAGISQAELAKMMRMRPSYLSLMLRDGVYFKALNVDMLCLILKANKQEEIGIKKAIFMTKKSINIEQYTDGQKERIFEFLEGL